MKLFLYFSMIDESFDLFYCKSVDIPDFAMCFTTLFHTKDFTKDLFYFLYSIAMTNPSCCSSYSTTGGIFLLVLYLGSRPFLFPFALVDKNWTQKAFSPHLCVQF